MIQVVQPWLANLFLPYPVISPSWIFFLGRTESLLLCSGFSSCGEQGLLPSCGAWAPHCGVFSCCELSTSVVVAHGLSCSVKSGIFLEQGSNHVPCISRQILNHWTSREVLGCLNFLWSHQDPLPFPCHPTSGSSLYNTIFLFIAWTALPSVSLTFENSTIRSTER